MVNSQEDTSFVISSRWPQFSANDTVGVHRYEVKKEGAPSYNSPKNKASHNQVRNAGASVV